MRKLISQLLRRDPQEHGAETQLRQAKDLSTSAKPTLRIAEGGANREIYATNTGIDDDQGAEVASSDMLPAWRLLVTDYVRDSDADSCAVLDLEMRTALVLGTREFFASGGHGALLQALKSKGWTVEAERTSTKEVIAEVRAENVKRRRSGSLKQWSENDEANVQMYKDIIRGAFEMGASDIHIRLGAASGKSAIRLRIDGDLHYWKKFETKVLNDALASAFNGLSIKGTNSAGAWTTERPINTITQVFAGNIPLHGRLSSQPTSSGCAVVIRIIDASAFALEESTLQKSGFTDQQIHEDLLPALRRTHGFILVSGSTGDGKTTTLQRMLLNLPDRDARSLWGVEDPNEMEVPGVEHISIQRSADDNVETVRHKFNAALLQLMRLDPCVILLGEVRDRVTGEFASEAVMTGHLLLLALHGNSAIKSIMRLTNEKIGVPAENLADAENFGVSVAQKLVPLLCEHCKVPATKVMPMTDLAILRDKYGLDVGKIFCAKSDGCDHCRRSPGFPANGQHGRTVAAEIISNPTAEFFKCVRRKDADGARLAWRKTRRAPFTSPDMRGKTSYEHAIYLVGTGKVSPMVLEKVFGVHYRDADVVTVELLTIASEAA